MPLRSDPLLTHKPGRRNDTPLSDYHSDAVSRRAMLSDWSRNMRNAASELVVHRYTFAAVVVVNRISIFFQSRRRFVRSCLALPSTDSASQSRKPISIALRVATVIHQVPAGTFALYDCGRYSYFLLCSKPPDLLVFRYACEDRSVRLSNARTKRADTRANAVLFAQKPGLAV